MSTNANMSEQSEFELVFRHFKGMLGRYADALSCVTDQPDDYYLNTFHIMKNKKPLFFGSVQIKKRYVSYHLMPVYVFPELLQDISPELRRRMQGKSCFNFKAMDDELFGELDRLTAAGFERYQQAGYV